MTRSDEDYLIDCIEEIMQLERENNIILNDICSVVNMYLSNHNKENEEDFMRNVLANLISSGMDINGLFKRV